MTPEQARKVNEALNILKALLNTLQYSEWQDEYKESIVRAAYTLTVALRGQEK